MLTADVATAEGFTLVGAALNILAVVDRRTQDLDYFHLLHDPASSPPSGVRETVVPLLDAP